MAQLDSVNMAPIWDRWSSGDGRALDSLLPVVYAELRELAAFYLAKEHAHHTLQPTCLVHETWMRLTQTDPGRVTCKNHFFATAAQVMRRLLVEHARRKRAYKRAGQAERIVLELDVLARSDEGSRLGHVDVLDLHLALEDLAQISESQARIVELRYFGGLTTAEIVEVMNLSASTVDRQWRAARIWLRRRLESYR